MKVYLCHHSFGNSIYKSLSCLTHLNIYNCNNFERHNHYSLILKKFFQSCRYTGAMEWMNISLRDSHFKKLKHISFLIQTFFFYHFIYISRVTITDRYVLYHFLFFVKPLRCERECF